MIILLKHELIFKEQLDDYKFISLDDKVIFTKAFKTNFPRISEYTFTNLYMWRFSYNFYWKNMDDTFIFLASFKDRGNSIIPCIFPPILLKARDSLAHTEILEIRRNFFSEYIRLRNIFKRNPELHRFDESSISLLFSFPGDIPSDLLKKIDDKIERKFDNKIEQKSGVETDQIMNGADREKNTVNLGENDTPILSTADLTDDKQNPIINLKFQIIGDRNNWDYLYSREQLLKLPGKSFLSIRRKINKFKKENNWSFELLNKEQIEHCLILQEHWCNIRNCDDNEALSRENSAILDILKHKDELDYTGIVLYANDKIVAFCIGEKLNPNTYVCHVEKANHEIFGAYQVINQLFAEKIAVDAEYLNREQDLGEEGLRLSKMRYKPNEFIHKYVLTLVD